MSKMKNYMMTIEDKVDNVSGIMEKMQESESLVELINFVMSEIKLESAYAQSIAKDYITQTWNEYWSVV
jgi:hypothetical protein